MATFRRKLPSQREALLLFAACAFVVYSWTMVVTFWEVPGWQKYLDAGEISVIVAYAFTSALVESFLVFAVVIFLRVVLPAQIFRERFIAKATMLILMNTLWAILLHLIIISDEILTWTPRRYLLSTLAYLLSVAFSWAFVHLSEFFAKGIEAFVDRTTVFLYLYVPLGVVGIFVVMVRNIL